MTGNEIRGRAAVARKAPPYLVMAMYFGLPCALAAWMCLGCSGGGGGGDTKPPSVPANVTANVLSTTSIRVSWTASTDDSGVAGYRLSCGGVSENDGKATSYDDTGLTPGTSYCYTVLAYDAAGNESARSNQACATTPTSSYVLSVERTGSGTVTSSPGGISCGTDCSEPYSSGTLVTLTATAASGSTFAGWTGCDSASATTCTVTMTADKAVVASFDVVSPGTSYTLTVSRSGAGSGTVSSSPAGISCAADCSEPYSSGTLVTLTATAASGSTFAGWTGCDSVSGATCTVTMTADKAVGASFNVTPSLQVRGTYTFWLEIDAACGWPRTTFFWPVTVQVTSYAQGVTVGWVLFPSSSPDPSRNWSIVASPTHTQLVPGQASPGAAAAAYNIVVDGGTWEAGGPTRSPLDGRGEIRSGTATDARVIAVFPGSDQRWECRSDAGWKLLARWSDTD